MTNSLTVTTSNGTLAVDLPVAAHIHALAATCYAPETIEGVEALERLAKEPVTFAALAEAKELRDEAHSAHKAIEEQRKTAKAPFTQGGKVVDSIAASLLDRLATVKAMLSAAIARVEAKAEADRKAALATACAAAAEGKVDVAATAKVNELADAKASWRWQYRCVDVKRLYAEAPEYCKLEPDGMALQQVALATPKDREPPAIPGVVWEKVPFSRAGSR